MVIKGNRQGILQLCLFLLYATLITYSIKDLSHHPYNVDDRKLSGNDEGADGFYGVLTDVSSS